MNPAMSSWVALRRRVPPQPGQSDLGAIGNAGAMAVQVAKRLGAGRMVGGPRPRPAAGAYPGRRRRRGPADRTLRPQPHARLDPDRRSRRPHDRTSVGGAALHRPPSPEQRPRLCLSPRLRRRSFRRAGVTPVAVGYVAAVRLAVAPAHLVRRLLVVAVHETSYLARQ